MSALRAAVTIAIFAILSKVLGLLKFMVLSNRFGAGAEVDIYVTAFRVPDLIFNILILGTLSAAFLPVFVSYLNRDRQEAFQIAATIFNLTFLAMGAFAALGFIFAPGLVKLLAPGFTSDAQAQTAELSRIMMLSPLLFSLSSVLTSVLHSFKRFVIAAIAPLFYNLAIIAGILFLYPVFGLSGLAWGVVMGAGLHFILQFPPVWRLGLRPFSSFAVDHAGVKKITKLFGPRMLALDLGQVSLLTATVIGSSLAAGSIASFYYAYELETIVLGIVAMSFAIAAFPTMAGFLGKGDYAGFKKFLAETSVQILFLMIPVSVLMLLLRAQIVRLVLGALEGTKFTFADTKLTANTLGFFVLSLFSQSLVPLFARAFFALQNTITPLLAGTAAAVTNVVLAVFFQRFDGSPSMLALAFSIASILNLVILAAMLRRKVGDLHDDFILIRVVKISIASMIMGTFVYLTLHVAAPLVNMQTYLGILIQTAAAAAVAAATYLAAGLTVSLPETRQVLVILKNWFDKFSKPVTSVIVNMFTDLR